MQLKESCLYVKDLDHAERFYHRILQLPIISRAEGRHIFFRAGSVVLLCFLPEVTKKEEHLPPHFGYGQQHLAFEVSEDEYDFWKNRIIAEKIEMIHEEKWSRGKRSFYFHDFDKNLVEIVMTGLWD